MVLRRRAGEPGVSEMPLRSRVIASVGGDLHCGKSLVTSKPARYVTISLGNRIRREGSD